jgi:hypothetical protein
MRQGDTLSTAPRHGYTRLPTHARLRRADSSPPVSGVFALTAICGSQSLASRFPYLVPYRYAMRRTDARCLSLDADWDHRLLVENLAR